ncbi:unnamed protein product [Litomosoides sigmodontis]|uniref:Uncharacterized protein n=1 Tax=Litomosoides sigmodontis TaxID=42156 RepID=A0A3P6UFJ6_LITSI|nr:unnamed protein product [Litomosoides sigmodontis]
MTKCRRHMLSNDGELVGLILQRRMKWLEAIYIIRIKYVRPHDPYATTKHKPTPYLPNYNVTTAERHCEMRPQFGFRDLLIRAGMGCMDHKCNACLAGLGWVEGSIGDGTGFVISEEV